MLKKQLNDLIYGAQEDPGNAWENRETTIEKFQIIFKKWSKNNRSCRNKVFKYSPHKFFFLFNTRV